jgi:hypothetical protein
MGSLRLAVIFMACSPVITEVGRNVLGGVHTGHSQIGDKWTPSRPALIVLQPNMHKKNTLHAQPGPVEGCWA